MFQKKKITDSAFLSAFSLALGSPASADARWHTVKVPRLQQNSDSVSVLGTQRGLFAHSVQNEGTYRSLQVSGIFSSTKLTNAFILYFKMLTQTNKA